MPEPTAEDRRAAAQEGFLGHLAGLLSASAGYLQGRLQLLGLESKEAAVHYAIIVGLLIAALVVLVFGYFFLCFFAIFGLAALIEAFTSARHAYIWVTLGMALLHIGAAVGAVLYAKARFAEPMFTATINEFKKDQEWLTPQKSVN
ncbi:MAG TPA: phage holin family protein [Chthoniobacteraceae bacterium]|jgi:uncharacterized membrane protein YqjE|nr:phage holin family protein [Chthoniobacteraceae bacterium]